MTTSAATSSEASVFGSNLAFGSLSSCCFAFSGAWISGTQP